MFKEGGDLFYPAFEGDPAFADFITGENVNLSLFPESFPNPQGPTALAEFFGDHMVVNGKIWPVTQVEPRNYRLRLLNGCDSRFLLVEFFVVNMGDTDFTNALQVPLDFTIIGADQELARQMKTVSSLLMETGRCNVPEAGVYHDFVKCQFLTLPAFAIAIDQQVRGTISLLTLRLWKANASL